MNKLMRVASLVVFVLALGYSAVSYAVEDEFVAAQDHATLAGLYEKKAAEQNSLINQHGRMKVDSGWLKRINFNASAVAEMQRHCDAIIDKAKALKGELQSTAEWHKKQA